MFAKPHNFKELKDKISSDDNCIKGVFSGELEILEVAHFCVKMATILHRYSKAKSYLSI